VVRTKLEASAASYCV